MTIQAWHFLTDDGVLRDGRLAPDDGVPLIHEGPLAMCESGLHASRSILDALSYAPGALICRVRCGGEITEYTDKLVCRERTILWRVAGEEVLREFARRCALDVIHLWDPPEVVVRYLKTGDEEIWAAAWAAARDAAGDAAWAAAWAAAWDAARAAARDAAGDAAGDAARAAARARDAAGAAARARDAAGDAARAAAWAAARDAAGDAAGDAAWDAAWDAARAKHRRRLVAMVAARRSQ